MTNLKGVGLGKFLVIERDDVFKYLDDRERQTLGSLLDKIAQGRYEDNKSICNSYVIINKEEEYIDKIIKIMKENGHSGK